MKEILTQDDVGSLAVRSEAAELASKSKASAAEAGPQTCRVGGQH